MTAVTTESEVPAGARCVELVRCC